MKHNVSRLLIPCATFLGVYAQPALAGALRFDLICKGVEQGAVGDGSYKRSASIPTDVRIAVDLAEKQWCYSKCRVVGNIEFDANEITLSGGPTGIGLPVSTINRRTGSMTKEVPIGKAAYSISLIYTYICKVGPYTGIPKGMF